jgi:flagellar biosynthesis chaperone FliJ
MGKFRFGLQALLDEHLREEERARALFARAERAYERARDLLREIETAAGACDRSAFVVLDDLERARIPRRRGAEEARAARERARIAFEQARTARMRITILRERAYGTFLEEEERKAERETDEANAASSRLRLFVAGS